VAVILIYSAKKDNRPNHQAVIGELACMWTDSALVRVKLDID